MSSTPTNSPQPTKPRRRRLFKRTRRRLGRWLVQGLGGPLWRLYARSFSIDLLREEHLKQALADHGGCFITLWHGRMLVGMHHHRDRDYHVLVSKSGDGDISEALLEAMGYHVVRGSSSRGGARALREMLGILKSGGVMVLTPDGPRGPSYGMNLGVAWLARATGFPIVACGLAASPARTMKSWDRFCIPKFRSKVAVCYGEPFLVPRRIQEDELEQYTHQLRERMLDTQALALAHLGQEPDWE